MSFNCMLLLNTPTSPSRRGEINRPEYADLKPLVAKLTTAKQAIDEGAASVGQAPITWADTIVVAGKVATELSWVDIKIKRAALESGGRTIAEQFGTEFPLQLGRLDATEPDAASGLPSFDAPVEEITVCGGLVNCDHTRE